MLKYAEFLNESKIISQKDLNIIFKDQDKLGFVNKFVKTNSVEARLANKGEKVITMIDGKKETSNIAKEGDIVIKNPDGEIYTLDRSKYSSRYSGPTLTDNFQKVKCTGTCYGMIWANGNTKIQAESGEPMRIENGDVLATTNTSNTDRYYRIEKTAFLNTYKLVKK